MALGLERKIAKENRIRAKNRSMDVRVTTVAFSSPQMMVTEQRSVSPGAFKLQRIDVDVVALAVEAAKEIGCGA